MNRSQHRFFELLPSVPQETGDGREGKLFVNGDRFILKFSLLMMSFQAVWRLLKPIVTLLVGIGSPKSRSFETIMHSERSGSILKTLCY